MRIIHHLLLSISVMLPQLTEAQRVVGGTDVPEGKYPFVAALINRDSLNLFSGYKCGSSLIAPQWLLSAAHCVDGGTLIDAAIGTNSLTSPFQSFERIPIEEVFIHPLFDASNEADYDIALLKLPYPLTGYPTIELPSEDDEDLYHAGQECTIIGWGLKDTMLYTHHDYLQEADVQVISSEICNDSTSYDGLISQNMFCAGVLQEPIAGAAIGDSGSPLVVEESNQVKQIGVVMGGHDDWTTIRFPGVYQKTIVYRAWIDSIILANSITPLNHEVKPDGFKINFDNNILTISRNQAFSNVEVLVFDNLGRAVYRSTIISGKDITIEFGGFTIGAYFVVILEFNKNNTPIKIIKIR